MVTVWKLVVTDRHSVLVSLFTHYSFAEKIYMQDGVMQVVDTCIAFATKEDAEAYKKDYAPEYCLIYEAECEEAVPIAHLIYMDALSVSVLKAYNDLKGQIQGIWEQLDIDEGMKETVSLNTKDAAPGSVFCKNLILTKWCDLSPLAAS